MTTQQDREELIAFVKANACGGSYFNLQMERVAALLAEDGRAGGEVVATLHDDGHFTWKSNDLRMKHGSNFAGWRMDVYTHPQPAQVAHPLPDDQRLACASNIADSILFDLQGRKQLLDGVDEQVLQEIVAEHTSIILNGLAAHGIGKDQP